MIYPLLLLTIYIWPFGQLLSFSFPNLPFTLYLLDLAVFLVFISLIISSKRKQIFSNPITKPLIIFLTAAIMSLLVNLQQGISSDLPTSAFYLLRLIVYPSLFFAGNYIGFSRLRKPLLISLGIFSLLCLLQYLFFPDMRYLKNLGFDDHYFRLIGPFYDPNFTGAILAGVALYFISQSQHPLSVPLVGLLALTFSRASYLSFLTGTIFLLISKKKIKYFLLVGLLSVVIYLIPKPSGEGVNLLRTFSIFSRIDSWQQGLSLFAERPIIGWGYNTLRNIDGSRFQIDNSFIYILATTGIAGFLSFIYLVQKILVNTKNKGFKLLFISLLIHSLFNNTLFYIWILALAMITLGLGQEKTKEYKST
ncbi:MAG TPA: O-antigen ligase family protein [Spirochaetia bacterium]|nr:O-antigen ligase family protein [Spirochaetia bacterium]